MGKNGFGSVRSKGVHSDLCLPADKHERYIEVNEVEIEARAAGFQSKRWGIPLVASLFLSGCIIERTVIPDSQRLLPAQTRSFKDLLQDLEARSRAIQTLKLPRSCSCLRRSQKKRATDCDSGCGAWFYSREPAE